MLRIHSGIQTKQAPNQIESDFGEPTPQSKEYKKIRNLQSPLRNKSKTLGNKPWSWFRNSKMRSTQSSD
jgi:hypothetical protein